MHSITLCISSILGHIYKHIKLLSLLNFKEILNAVESFEFAGAKYINFVKFHKLHVTNKFISSQNYETVSL